MTPISLYSVLVLQFLTLAISGMKPKPNIVLFLADDLGIGDIGCFGNTTIRTPNIDRLALEGVKLTQHISAASVCTPSRAAFLTGRYPIRSGMTGHGGGHSVLIWTSASGGLPANETTFPKILKEQGYATGIIGKWHLGLNCDSRTDFCHHPLNHGFDYFYGSPFTLVNDCQESIPSEIHVAFKKQLWFYAQLFALTLATMVAGKLMNLLSVPWKVIFFFFAFGLSFFSYWYMAYHFYRNWNCILMRNFEIIGQPMNLETMAAHVTEEAKAFIERNRDGPFLLLVSFLHIHAPFFTTEKFRGTSRHKLYGDNIEEMDWMVGEILDVIDQEGLANNTLTYFTSDNGAFLQGMEPDYDLRGSNGIYRGGKGMGGLEGGIRVPGIFRWPGVLPSNTTVDQPTSLMDIFTTVITLGGGRLPKDRVIDGKDLMPLMQGLTSKQHHDFMFHYCWEYLHAVRWHEVNSNTVWKVHFFSPKFSPEGSGTCPKEKLCSCSGETVIHHVPPLLFNLSNDPSEEYPLSHESTLYSSVLQTIQQAVTNHNLTINSVPRQLYGSKNRWTPGMQVCCGTFPFCSCDKED
ncbi:arylsulfatase H-like [Spea bombifrons]|uniref:arylsulfatase H-like n=1 Tax=Spea bombifrons TaxID=233779 RepID=UPI00234A96AE|nr:arylsulfatase H-like [Spea bombifrons]